MSDYILIIKTFTAGTVKVEICLAANGTIAGTVIAADMATALSDTADEIAVLEA